MIACAIALAGLLLGVRAVHLSFSGEGASRVLAAEQSAEEAAMQPRGDILSADGRMLATSIGAYRLVATPYQIEDAPAAAEQLAEVLGPETEQEAPDIQEALTKENGNGGLAGYSVVSEEIDPETARKVEELGLAGLTLDPRLVRVYPDGTLASQTTGHLGSDEAFGGIEAAYDETLGEGEDVSTTIDGAVQQQLQDALKKTVEENDAESALGIVMRADDGAVVAQANWPTFDNNDFRDAPPELQRDRNLTDPYEPGSTFKSFTVAAALEEGSLSPQDNFTVPDHMPVGGHIIHDSEPHPTEVMSPEDILKDSSNVGTVQIAQGLGGEELSEYIERFGFGAPTGVDLWGEASGSVPAYADWSGVSIGNIPIGQGLSATPLQVVAGYAALVNGGTAVTPHVAESAGGEEVPTDTGRRMISENTSDIVRGMLRSVVEEGTGHLAHIPGYTVGGKTGTSEKVDPETGTYTDEYIASFVGFAPADDPEYVALIAVDEPQETFWGEVVAAPAFGEVMGFTLGYYNVPPDRTAEERAAEEKAAQQREAERQARLGAGTP